MFSIDITAVCPRRKRLCVWIRKTFVTLPDRMLDNNCIRRVEFFEMRNHICYTIIFKWLTPYAVIGRLAERLSNREIVDRVYYPNYYKGKDFILYTATEAKQE